MARFTASVPLNIKWANHAFVGTPSTTYRVTDALVEEFVEEVVPGIPGFAWVTQDELTSVVTLPIAEADVTGLVADLASKYDKAGGIISGAASVTGVFVAQAATTVAGNFVAQSAATVAGALVAQGSQTVANALTVGGATNLSSTLGVTSAVSLSSTLGVTGAATLLAAVNASSTLGVTGKLTLGNVVTWGGTAFPGSPANNDLYYRTDLDLLFFYDGTRWLSVQQFEDFVTPTTTIPPLAATTGAAGFAPIDYHGGADIWIESVRTAFFVNSGGTALGASHKWVATVFKAEAGNATSIATVNVDSGASASWRTDKQTINALLGTTPLVSWRVDWTKTGTPGTLLSVIAVLYRVVAT
jgi:hypothetical protein